MSSKALGRPCLCSPGLSGEEGMSGTSPSLIALLSEDGSFQEAMALLERRRPAKPPLPWAPETLGIS